MRYAIDEGRAERFCVVHLSLRLNTEQAAEQPNRSQYPIKLLISNHKSAKAGNYADDDICICMCVFMILQHLTMMMLDNNDARQ